MTATTVLHVLLIAILATLASALPPTRVLHGPYAPARFAFESAPSASPSASALRRRQVVQTALEAVPSHPSYYLCPPSTAVCALEPSPSSVPRTLEDWALAPYECVDFESDITGCGGCASDDPSHDCTAIPEALAVSCVRGGCQVDSCLPGFVPSSDRKACVQAPSARRR